jgi:hypothetical protein
MEDYIHGCVCGYLTVQNQRKDDGKKKKMFIILSDSRMSYYLLDPRPKFDRPVDGTYLFQTITQLHYYAALNPKAPSFSICLTTDKNTDVFIAENHQEMEIWYHAIQNRLEALATMLKGHFMIRKTLNAEKQIQRFLLNTKYTWRKRFVELGRSSLLFCNESKQNKKSQNKIFKQFLLNSSSYVIEENIEQIHQVIGNFYKSVNSITTSHTEKICTNSTCSTFEKKTKTKFPFTVCTGQAYLVLAASTRAIRNEWILAIRLRIVALKHRQHPLSTDINNTSPSLQFHGFMEIKDVVGNKWKKRYILVENGLIRIKKNERHVGAFLEIPLLPTCSISISSSCLMKANSFCVKNLGKQIHLACRTNTEAKQWMDHIQEAANQVTPIHCEKIFEKELKEILKESSFKVWKYHQPPVSFSSFSQHYDDGHTFVLEKFNQRIFVKNHLPPSDVLQQAIPKGSILIAIKEHELVYESFENQWHKLRHRHPSRHPSQHSLSLLSNKNEILFLFRLPIERIGIVYLKKKIQQKEWTKKKMILANGMLSLQSENLDILWEFPLRNLQFHFISETKTNGKNNCMTISNTITGELLWYLHVFLEEEFLLWFGLLHLESCLARNDPRFPLVFPSSTSKMMHHENNLNNTNNTNNTIDTRNFSFLKCHFFGKTIASIEKNAENYMKNILEEAMFDKEQEEKKEEEKEDLIDSSKTSKLTEEEIKHLFKLFDTAENGKISTMTFQQKLDLLTVTKFNCTTKPVIPWKELLFHSIPNDVTLETFTNFIHEISLHPEAINILRQFSRGEIQCL